MLKYCATAGDHTAFDKSRRLLPKQQLPLSNLGEAGESRPRAAYPEEYTNP